MLALPLRLSLLAFAVASAEARAADCSDPVPAAGAALARTLTVRGTGEQRIELPPLTAPVAIRAIESGIDVTFEVLDGRNNLLARSASPTIRSGSQVAYIETGAPKTIVVRGIEHARHGGLVTVIARRSVEACRTFVRALATSDARYAAARSAAQGAPGDGERPAAEIFADAARKYETALATPGLGAAGRGALELELASIAYYDLSEWQSSADWATRAAQSFKTSGDLYGNARARAILAAAWMELGTASAAGGGGSAVPADSRARFDSARELLTELEQFHLRRGEEFDAALQTNNIGLAYYYEARFAEAMPRYVAAMKVFEKLNETPRVALTLQNIALCEWGQGRLTAALPRFDRALALMDPRAHPDLYLLTLNSSALAHYAAGKFDASLELHTRGLEVSKRVQNDTYRGRSLMGLGITYYAIGDHQLARQFLRSALDVLSAELDGRGRTTTLRALAVVEHDDGRFADAIKYNLEALKFSVAASARARIKVRLGADYAALGELPSARAELDSVERDPPGGDALVRAEARLELARVLKSAGSAAAAERMLTQALTGFQSMQSVAGEFESRFEIARLLAATGREAAALASLREALRLSDEIATQTGNPEYRASVVESLRPAQELMVDLLFAQYARATASADTTAAARIAGDALAFADGTRARVFSDILAQRFQDDDPARAKLLAERESVLRDLADRRFYLSTREDRKGPEDALAKELRAQIAALRAQLGVKNSELAKQASNDATIYSPTASGPLEFKRAKSNRMFVEYWLGAENSYAWCATRTSLRWMKLRGARQIDRAARGIHESMRHVLVTGQDSDAERADRRRALADLYGMLIAPLGTLGGIDEVAIAADGALHVVPFAALRGAGAADRYLVNEVSIAFVPALRFAGTAGDLPRAKPSGGRLLIVDDPVYQSSDRRVAEAQAIQTVARASGTGRAIRGGDDLARLPRLFATAREAAAIRREYAGKFGANSVELLEGLDATKAGLMSKRLASYQFIHVATHGTIDMDIPQLSALILGRYGRTGVVGDQRVWVDDLLAQTLNADAVVLSACDTSLGPEFAGEGPIGLRYAALARGAHSVVSSLWPVADEITASLMAEMYGELTTKSNRADLALAIAMRKLLARSPQLDPVLWAPYTATIANR